MENLHHFTYYDRNTLSASAKEHLVTSTELEHEHVEEVSYVPPLLAPSYTSHYGPYSHDYQHYVPQTAFSKLNPYLTRLLIDYMPKFPD